MNYDKYLNRVFIFPHSSLFPKKRYVVVYIGKAGSDIMLKYRLEDAVATITNTYFNNIKELFDTIIFVDDPISQLSAKIDKIKAAL